MKKYPNLLILFAVLLLLLLFAAPLWRITLEAPQYPDGISMFIWINKITGDTEYTLQNINILNHYIGMKYIEPDSIPELIYFPWVVGFMALFGLFAAFSKKKYVRLSWVVTLLILSGLGVYDFYLWEYDYGHNLSPTAPIKVPGMVYQPPLFGTKMLLNFNAASYPHWGGIALIASIIVGCFSCWREWDTKSETILGRSPALAAVALLVYCVSCSNEPQPIAYGNTACDYCMMTVVDPRFGALAISQKGKHFTFDATECMLNYLNSNKGDLSYTTYVTAFNKPNTLMGSTTCYFLINSSIPSPMGMYLTAYPNRDDAYGDQQKHGGKILNWQELSNQFDSIALVK